MGFTRTVTANTSDPSRPDWRRPEVLAILPDLNLIHRLMGGTAEMWAHANEYIRKWTDEAQELFDIRKTIETVYGALERVTSASIGMLFAHAPQIEWNQAETQMSPHWKNIDGAGTGGVVFTKRFAEQSLLDGLGFLVVDHPPAPRGPDGQPRELSELEQGGFFRPKWALYGRRQLCSWKTATIDNEERLSQIVFEEAAAVDDGTYGIEAKVRYRVFMLAQLKSGEPAAIWQLLEESKDAAGHATYATIGSGVFRNRAGQTRPTLPLQIAYTGRTDAMVTADPPLLPVAYANLSHWQKATNLSFYEDFSAFPQPVVTGTLAPDPVTGKASKLRVGPGTGVHVTEGGKYEIIELQGTAMEQLRKGLDEKLHRIASTALSFLLPQTRAAETAEAKRLDATAENATLATAAQAIEDAINGAYIDHAWYLGIEEEQAPVMSINRDFENTALGADVMHALAALRKEGYPVRPILELMQAGGRIKADADLDALELEWLAGEVGEADARQTGPQAA